MRDYLMRELPQHYGKFEKKNLETPQTIADKTNGKRYNSIMARDLYHDAVKRALQKEGWQITADPLKIPVEDTNFLIDLGAERLIAAELGSERIAVEIKVFGGVSLVADFHLALGQVLNYSLILREIDPNRKLWLAIPADTYQTFFHGRYPTRALAHIEVGMIVFNPNSEVIEQWI